MAENDVPSAMSALPSKIASDIALAAAGELNRGLRETIGEVWSGLVGDRIREWRQRNLIDALERTAKHIASKGLDLEHARVLPNGELYRIFEGSSKTDSPSLSEMWASLLASAMDPDSGVQVDEALAKVLEQLTGHDADLFLAIRNFESETDLALDSYNALFDEMSRRRMEYEKQKDEGKISYTSFQGHEDNIWKENARALEELEAKLKNSADAIVAKIEKLPDVEVCRVNLQRLGLIEARPTNRALPDLFSGFGRVGYQTTTERFQEMENEYLQSLESLREWMYAIMDQLVADSELRVLEVGEGRSVLNYRISKFGCKFAKACIG